MVKNLLKISLWHGGKIAQIMAKIATFQTKNDDILTLFPREKVEKVESRKSRKLEKVESRLKVESRTPGKVGKVESFCIKVQKFSVKCKSRKSAKSKVEKVAYS